VGLAGGGEVVLDADVQLLLPELEPDAAALPQRLGLLDLREADQLPEEATRLRLAARWGGDLDVVEPRSIGHPRMIHVLGATRCRRRDSNPRHADPVAHQIDALR
jgi:hypothetical protein